MAKNPFCVFFLTEHLSLGTAAPELCKLARYALLLLGIACILTGTRVHLIFLSELLEVNSVRRTCAQKLRN